MSKNEEKYCSRIKGLYLLWCTRNTRPEVFLQKQPLEVFYVKRFFRNLTKFIGKHLCQSLFFNKVASLRTPTLLKKRLWHRCFLTNFVKFLRTHFDIEHLWTTASILRNRCSENM